MRSPFQPLPQLATALGLLLGLVIAPIYAQVCPFENSSASLANEGLVLTRYALGLRNAPLVANTAFAAVDATTIADTIACASCGLNVTSGGTGTFTVADATIISRKIAGYSGAALTDGLGLSAPTVTAVNSFLLAGCGVPNAFVQGGNAFGAPAVLGTTDAQPVTVSSAGGSVSLLVNAVGDGMHIGNAANQNERSPNIVNGASVNSIASSLVGATIAGGGRVGLTNLSPTAPQTIQGNYGTISGGTGNTAGVYANVGGGADNAATAFAAVVGGGWLNTASLDNAVVSGGYANAASGGYATVGGGGSNIASASFSTVVGGSSNTASGQLATVIGGVDNIASGAFSMAAGRHAKARYQGAFMWADSTDLDFKVQGNEFAGIGSGWASAIDTFNARATGGVWFVTAVNGTTGRPTAGAFLSAGSGTWASTSDRAAKTAIAPVNAQGILRKVAALPISSWQYLTETGVRHIGPMSQDFKRLFAVGPDDRSITTIDADGVALAAIQGLNQIVQKKDAEIAALKRRLAAIEKRLGIQ